MVRSLRGHRKALGGSVFVAFFLVALLLRQGAFARTPPPVPAPHPKTHVAASSTGGDAAILNLLRLVAITEIALPSFYAKCTSNPSGALGPYSYSSIVNSNGYNTYVGNNMWAANPGTTQTVCATDPGHWTAVANAGPNVNTNTGVQTYPDDQQLFNNWTGSGWNQGSTMTDTPLSALHSLSSTYSTTNPSVGDFEAAYDIWLNNTPASEVMIWVYNVNRGTGGATVLGHTTLSGVPVTVMRYGSGELILSLDNNQAAGTIDILQALKYLQSDGLVSSGATLAQVDFGWEICNTAGKSLTFGVNNYSISGS